VSAPARVYKTSAVVLRNRAYGEADRILHLYTPSRGRVGAIAKGIRRTRSRFGGRLEPFSRVRLICHEGRGDLVTITSVETLDAHARLREQAATLDLLSNGRFDFGIGKGYRWGEFHGFCIPMEEAEERYQETVAFLRKAWTTTGRFCEPSRMS